MSVLYLLSVWAHILAAAVWIGSMAFFAVAVVPALRRAGLPMVRAIGERFRCVAWACHVVLVVTGVATLYLRGVGTSTLLAPELWATGFGRTLAHKLALVALVIVVTVGHDALASSPERRRLTSWLGRTALVLSVGVVLLAVALVRGAAW